MAQNESDADSLSASRGVLNLLDGLKQTPAGIVIHDQLARLAEEQESVRARVDHTYASLLHLLLEAYARDPSPDHIIRLNAHLIQLRRGLASTASTTVLHDKLDEQIHQAAASAARKKSGPGLTADPVAAPRQDEVGTTSPSGNSAPLAERRVNDAYRLHLDRQHDEIEKLQDALARSVTDAITQNREFGALLQVELRALQQAEGEKEIENLRQILVGGLEELIGGQSSLDTKLHRTESYLKLVKTDSQRLCEELSKVRTLSLTDEFTGLPNRRAFMRRLQDEASRAQRFDTPLALVMIDLDGFKAVNDVHGHTVGDHVLRFYATEVLTVLRHHDLVARYGGEEFMVILPNTTLEGAIAAMAKVRSRALGARCNHQGESLPIPTFSAGITLYAPDENLADLIDRVDRAMYRAKQLGRDRVEMELAGVTSPEICRDLSEGKDA